MAVCPARGGERGRGSMHGGPGLAADSRCGRKRSWRRARLGCGRLGLKPVVGCPRRGVGRERSCAADGRSAGAEAPVATNPLAAGAGVERAEDGGRGAAQLAEQNELPLLARVRRGPSGSRIGVQLAVTVRGWCGVARTRRVGEPGEAVAHVPECGDRDGPVGFIPHHTGATLRRVPVGEGGADGGCAEPDGEIEDRRGRAVRRR